jgi:hypothetical protein
MTQEERLLEAFVAGATAAWMGKGGVFWTQRDAKAEALLRYPDPPAPVELRCDLDGTYRMDAPAPKYSDRELTEAADKMLGLQVVTRAGGMAQGSASTPKLTVHRDQTEAIAKNGLAPDPEEESIPVKTPDGLRLSFDGEILGVPAPKPPKKRFVCRGCGLGFDEWPEAEGINWHQCGPVVEADPMTTHEGGEK